MAVSESRYEAESNGRLMAAHSRLPSSVPSSLMSLPPEYWMVVGIRVS
jgi:hypothetical protein